MKFISARETKHNIFGLILLQIQASLLSHYAMVNSMQYIHLKYDDFYLTLRVYFFYTFTLQCGEVQKKPSLVLFSVKSLSFAIPTAFENIQRIKKKKKKYQLRHIPTR